MKYTITLQRIKRDGSYRDVAVTNIESLLSRQETLVDVVQNDESRVQLLEAVFYTTNNIDDSWKNNNIWRLLPVTTEEVSSNIVDRSSMVGDRVCIESEEGYSVVYEVAAYGWDKVDVEAIKVGHEYKVSQIDDLIERTVHVRTIIDNQVIVAYRLREDCEWEYAVWSHKDFLAVLDKYTDLGLSSVQFGSIK